MSMRAFSVITTRKLGVHSLYDLLCNIKQSNKIIKTGKNLFSHCPQWGTRRVDEFNGFEFAHRYPFPYNAFKFVFALRRI